jgi:hypothetical protein
MKINSNREANMFKIIARIVLILFAAVIVCAGIYMVVNNSVTSTTLAGSFGEGFQNEQLRSSTRIGQSPPSGGAFTTNENFSGRGEDREGGSSRGWIGIGTNLVIIGLVTFMVIGVQKGVEKILGKRKTNLRTTA